MVRTSQFARILVLDVGRRLESVGGATHAAARGRRFASGDGHWCDSDGARAFSSAARENGKRGSYTQSRRGASPFAANSALDGARRSGRAPGLERGEGQRLARVAIGPQDELERLIVGLAGGDRSLHHGASIGRRSRSRRRRGRANGGTSPDPALLHRSKWPSHNCSLMSCVSSPIADALARRRLEIERAGDMERLHLRNPGEGDVVIGPGAGDQDGNLVVLGAVEGPFVDRGQALHDVDRMFGSIVGDSLDQAHQESFGARCRTRGRRCTRGRRASTKPKRPADPFLAPGTKRRARNLGDSCRIVNRAESFVHRISRNESRLCRRPPESIRALARQASPRARRSGRRAFRSRRALAPPSRGPPRTPRG